MNFIELKSKIIKAINLFYKHDAFLVEKNINERSVTHKLAEHLQREFTGYYVDCEYNRKTSDNIDADYIKKSLNLDIKDISTDDTEAKTVFPDIIIHERGKNKNNLLVIEVKKASNKNKKDIEFDEDKIGGYCEQLKYKFGLFLVIGYKRRAKYKTTWFKRRRDFAYPDPLSFEVSEGNINQLEQIVRTNFEIFKGMYEQDPYSLAHYQEKLKDFEPQIFIAKIDGQIVGDSISFERNGSLYIWIMGVLKEHRKKGIATKLFENNEQLARTNKYKSVTAKVYNVSKEMLRVLLARDYQITDVEQSEADAKYNAVHLELKI